MAKRRTAKAKAKADYITNEYSMNAIADVIKRTAVYTAVARGTPTVEDADAIADKLVKATMQSFARVQGNRPNNSQRSDADDILIFTGVLRRCLEELENQECQ